MNSLRRSIRILFSDSKLSQSYCNGPAFFTNLDRTFQPCVNSLITSNFTTSSIAQSLSGQFMSSTCHSWRTNLSHAALSRTSSPSLPSLITRSFVPLTALYSTRANVARRPSLAPLLSSKSRRKARGGELPVPASKAVVGFAIKDEYDMAKLYERIQVGLCQSESSEVREGDNDDWEILHSDRSVIIRMCAWMLFPKEPWLKCSSAVRKTSKFKA